MVGESVCRYPGVSASASFVREPTNLDYRERLACPGGVSAVIVRLSPALGFDVSVRVPAGMPLPVEALPDAAPAVGGASIVHRSFPALDAAEGWVLSFIAGLPV